MTLHRIAVLVLLFEVLSGVALGQVFPKEEISVDAFIQRIAATQQTDANYEEIYENLYQFYQIPLDLNQASAEELRSLLLLSELQINALLEHRQKFGNLLSIYELQAVPSFDILTIRQLAPFVQISPMLQATDFTQIFRRATNHFLLVRADQVLEPSRGFLEQKYLGTRQRLYTRYRLQHPQDFSLGFISEKDPGEANWLDYTTFHAQLQRKGLLKNVVLGDYQASFGQGLLLGAGYYVGKGSEAIYTVRRNAVGLRPHNSVMEMGFFRGGGATLQVGSWEATAFVGRNARSATLTDNETDDTEDRFSSLLISGLHRTEAEIAKKNAITEVNAGAAFTKYFPNGRVGLTTLYTQFSKTLQRTNRPYNQFEFSGRQNTGISADFSYNWQNINLFAEVARSSSGGVGGVGGWIASLGPMMEWAVSLRHYSPKFHSFYGNAFGEGSRVINEKGIYNGFKFTPRKGLIINAFYDKFSFPWLRYLVDAPSEGYDYLTRISYQPNKKWLFFTQFHTEHKQRNRPESSTNFTQLVQTKRQNLVAHAEYQWSRQWKGQLRGQLNRFAYESQPSMKGWGVWHDLEHTGNRWQTKARVAYFNSPEYNTRIYAYENDVLYAVSFPAYYGQGWRFYLMQRYTLSKQIDLWWRVARTQRTDGIAVGSGLDALGVPHRTDIRIQVRYSVL